MSDELAALGMAEGGGSAQFDAELIGLVGFSFTDAFDLGGVQGIDFGSLARLRATPLEAHAVRQAQILGEGGLQLRLAVNLAPDVAHDPAEIGLQLLQGLVGAPELMGVGIALLLDEHQLAEPFIGLPQLEPMCLGQLDQPIARAVQQLGLGRKGHGLGLHRGIDDHPGEFRRLQRLGLGRHRQALLEQRLELLLAHALAPAGQRGAIERQSVLEKLRAAEILEIWVLHPAIAQRLVREVMHVLQDQQPGHQPGRQRRMARAILVDRAKRARQEAPVGRPRKPRQRVIEVDDLVQLGAEEIELARLAWFLRPHRSSPLPISISASNHKPTRHGIRNRNRQKRP